jgi:hypothetical protein
MVGVAALVLHPWFVRYGVDARGYSLLFTLLPLFWLTLGRAVRLGTWSAWLLWGVVQCLVVWAYPGALYVLVGGNIGAVFAIWALHRAAEPGTKIGQWKRWLCANALGAACTLPLMLPLVEPMRHYLKRSRISGELTGRWFADAFSQLATGRPWFPWDSHALVFSWQEMRLQHPVWLGLFLMLLAGIFVLGIVSWWRRSLWHRSLLLAMLLPIPLFIAAAAAAGNILYEWYLLIGLPAVVLVAAQGCVALCSLLRGSWGRWKPIPALACLCIFAWATWHPTLILRRHPVEANRESIEFIRPVRHARNADLTGIRTLCFFFQTRGYDPAAVMVKNLDELKSQLREADAAGIPAYVHYGFQPLARQHYPEILAYLEDTRLFSPMPVWPGLDKQCSRHVYLYRRDTVK